MDWGISGRRMSWGDDLEEGAFPCRRTDRRVIRQASPAASSEPTWRVGKSCDYHNKANEERPRLQGRSGIVQACEERYSKAAWGY